MRKKNILNKQNNKLLLFIVILLVSFSVVGCSLFKKKYDKMEFEEHSLNVNNKTKISLNSFRGDIKISRNTDDSLLHIKAEKIMSVRKKDFDDPIKGMNVKIDTNGSIININSEVLGKERIFGLTFDTEDRINYDLKVPDNIKIEIDNTHGDLFITNTTNDVAADITNGDVKLEKAFGKTVLDITNGKVKGDLDSTKGLDIELTNGKVNLNLGETFSAKFKLDVTHGKIKKKDLVFKEETEVKSKDKDENYFEGNLGDSKAEVVIDVVNGRITLSRQ